MPHIHDIQCDYDNCTQMFKREPNNWWKIYIPSDTGTSIEISSLDTFPAEEIYYIKHACCVDHALKLVAREMEKLAPTLSEPLEPCETFVKVYDCSIDNDDIPF